MPTLNWIGKDKVINHHQDVEYKVLEQQYTYPSLPEGKETSENKIIHGDNLEALKSLLPQYEGKIKCIYIDPPYNTGNEGWVYNDNVNDPKIKKWLHEVVGKEGEDLSRHDKWLCMMYPRLKLLHKLLADDGAIFISIDEVEISTLKLTMDEIFGSGNYIEQLVWNKRIPKNDKYIGNIHEYVLLYVKNSSQNHKFTQKKEGIPVINELLLSLKRKKTSIPIAESEIKSLYKKNNYDRGITLYNSVDKDYKLWGKINMSWPNGQTFGPRYDVLHPKTNKPCKVPERGWRWTKDTFDEALDYDNIQELHDGSFICGRIWFAKNENTQPSSVKYLEDVSDFLLRSIISTKSEGTVSLKELTSERFDYPKPVDLVETLIGSFDTENSIILDSFAGSGTTAHAVLNLNKQDRGNRKFILIEMEDYANTITAERVQRVINGYGEGTKAVAGTGGDFSYFELGEPIFLDNDMLNEAIGIERIEEYVWFSETKSNYEVQPEKYLLGKKDQTAYYFYYQKDNMTTLNESFLRTLKTKAEQYIIYADNCLLEEKLMSKYHIIFKKIPRDITRF
jgi:adenine-specific DNA-methyltransferase